jgi:signal transduction histidine kinase
MSQEFGLTAGGERDDVMAAVEAHHDQARRIEALGLVSAGVAHEFSNLLTVMLGSLQQLRRQSLDAHGEEQLDRLESSARQATRLLRQFLSLARQQTGKPQLVNLNEAVQGFDKMLTHIAGENVDVAIELAPQPLLARVEPDQLELALLNLVRNASAAMARIGRIVIRTSGHRVDGLGGQPSVEVSVTDIGPGMSPEVVQHATDSFFTTKEPGNGTGLGLWMVQRFVSASDGKLDIQTNSGLGTTVRLIFPQDKDG